MNDGVMKSSMVKSKLYAGLFIGVYKPQSKDGSNDLTSYAKVKLVL
jgi:hypothetical protein